MKTWSPERGKKEAMAKVHYIGQPLAARRKPLPLVSVLEWCGVSLLMMSVIAVVLLTLREIAGRLTALAGREHSSLNEDR
jgi:hypothetical protein